MKRHTRIILLTIAVVLAIMLIIAAFYEKRPKGQYLSSIRVTITYMDDTKRTINSTNYLFGKFIPDSGEVARRIKIELCITPFYDEDIQATL